MRQVPQYLALSQYFFDTKTNKYVHLFWYTVKKDNFTENVLVIGTKVHFTVLKHKNFYLFGGGEGRSEIFGIFSVEKHQNYWRPDYHCNLRKILRFVLQ